MKIQHLAPKQLVITENNLVKFISYDTLVCTLDSNTNKVSITEGQPQSNTTAKHLNKFLQQFTNYKKYQDIKN